MGFGGIATLLMEWGLGHRYTAKGMGFGGIGILGLGDRFIANVIVLVPWIHC